MESPSHTAPGIWARQARPVMESIAASGVGPARAVVVGNAGSGKSTVLRELDRLLTDRRTRTVVHGRELDVKKTPAEHVLLVDDLHLLEPRVIDSIRARSEDPDAALVVASRPWPRLDALTEITRSLERSRPAVVLGHVSRSDVLTYLNDADQVIADACIDQILELTGGVSWLTSEALALHDERDCDDDRSHRALVRAVEDRVAHRLATVPAELRGEIEMLCVARPGAERARGDQDDLIAQGYAEGLLMRNGQPVPLVRAAVRATIPVGRLIDLSASVAEGLALAAAEGDPAYREWIGGLHDPAVGAALEAHADLALNDSPARALELYRGAVECGADRAALAGRRAQAAWASGDPELAGSILDEVAAIDDVPDPDRVADTTAAVWATRAMMRRSDATYRSLAPVGAVSRARATVAMLGTGRAEGLGEPTPAEGLPSAIGVAMELVDRGLRASLADDGADRAVADLVRASTMYTSASTSAPIAELPAVITAIVTMSVGDLETARTVIDDAIHGAQGGAWARPRLLLWRAWLAAHQARPTEAREALDRALRSSGSGSGRRNATELTVRDHLLAQAVQVTIARRYEDTAALEAVWRTTRDVILRADVDLYTLLPLAELVTAAARVDDTAHVQHHFARGLEIVDQLGSPPIWSAHLHWAGIHQGILRNRPDDLKPHARALMRMAPQSRVAAVMAQAGKVWTATLAGSVDADAVEAAAHGLAGAGLGWDGARLAGHGASRSTDRKVAARLLSCARELHPTETVRRPTRDAEGDQRTHDSGDSGVVLSERERDVAELVLQGKTYAEIGETIFISPRTAEHHIAHIRRRLGATSRSDLLSKLRVIVEQPVDLTGPGA